MNLKIPTVKPIINSATPIKLSNSQIKFFDDFSIENSKLGKLKVVIDKDRDDFDEIRILNHSGKTLAYDNFVISLPTSRIEDFFMRVNHDLCQTGARLGETLRLASIIELIGNNLDKIKLYSKDTAVLFHSKYGFEPKIKSFDERNMLLKKLSKLNSPEYKDLNEQAKDLIKRIDLDAIYPEKQRMYCVEASFLGKDYIEKLLKNGTQGDSTPFLYGMNMELTRNKIIRNKEFYNDLYKKHGIDFQIQE